MQINNSSTPPISFGAYRPKKVYKSIQEIENLKCCCCRKTMLTGGQIAKIKKSIEAPSAKVLKDKLFEEFKNSSAYHFIKILMSDHPNRPIRKLVEHENFNAALFELDEETEKAVRILSKRAMKLAGSANSTLRKIEKYEPYLDEKTQLTVQQLKIWAKRYRGKSFAEIFRIPEVIEERKALIKNFTNNYNGDKKPRQENPYVFLHRHRNDSDKDLIEALLKERLNTFEHVKKKSDKGPKTQNNGLGMCSACNGKRSDKEYPEFLAEEPQMIVNTQLQLDDIIELINKNKLVNHDSYPAGISERIGSETNHIIELDISKLKPKIKKKKK